MRICRNGHQTDASRCHVCREQYKAKEPELKKTYRENNKVAIKRAKSAHYLYNPKWYLLRDAKRRARKAGVPYTITEDDITISSHCPILGVEMRRGSREYAPSLDRINPSLGYVPGNVVVISNRANRIKNDATVDEIRLLLDWLESLA